MKEIIVKSQAEFDKIKRVNVDEEVIFEANHIKINCALEVYGILRLRGEIDSSWNGRYILAKDSSQVHNKSWGSSQVHNKSLDSSQVHNESWDSSQVHNESWGSSQVHNKSLDSSVVTCLTKPTSVKLFNFAVAIIPFGLKIKIQKSKTAYVQRFKPMNWFQQNGIKKTKYITLYKRVSKDFKTQENTENETLWKVGTTVTHPNWQPEQSECGKGKFHAVSRPYFADEFRGAEGDRYIAIRIALKDLYEWKNDPGYPHKIGARKAKVMYECDRYGRKIEEQAN